MNRIASMNRWLVPVVVAAVVLVIGVLAAVSAKDSSDDADDTKSSASQGRKHEDNRGGRAKADNEGKGHGPPSWAHGTKGKPDKAARKAAREEWLKLSPAQRQALIDRLVTDHAEGMKEWRECVLAEGDDCEKPVPPGLAKRR